MYECPCCLINEVESNMDVCKVCKGDLRDVYSEYLVHVQKSLGVEQMTPEQIKSATVIFDLFVKSQF